MKKRLLSIAVALVLAVSLVPACIAHADDDIRVTIDGQELIFADQRPVIVDGRTLVPVRGVFESLGFEVDWDDNTRSAVLVRHDFTVIIPIGSAAFTVNGRAYNLDVPAQIIGGRTMLPIRLPLESVGYDVDWDAAARTVVILTARQHYSGEAGDNVTWTLDTSTGVLTFDGTGPMWDWEWIWFSGAPWEAHMRSITSVIISDGITTVGEGAFVMASGLASVYMPVSVTRIGGGAFAGATSLTSADMSNVTHIEEGAFIGASSLTSIYMPSVTYIGEAAFALASSLTSVTIRAQDTEFFGRDIFYGTHPDFTIHAYTGSTAHDYAIANGHNFVPLD